VIVIIMPTSLSVKRLIVAIAMTDAIDPRRFV